VFRFAHNLPLDTSCTCMAVYAFDYRGALVNVGPDSFQNAAFCLI
jgi:hypothetical protein